MNKYLKVDRKDSVTEVCYDMERVKKFEILTTSELRRKWFSPLGSKGPWIHITFTSKDNNGFFETATFSSSKWRVEFS